MMENTSGLVPLGRAVLVAPFDIEEVRGGLIHIPETIKTRDQMVEQRATVVAVGDFAWDDERDNDNKIVPRAKPGDVVLVTKFAGYMALGTADGKQYRLINDRDIFARIEEEKEVK
jgi:co-chaperonin GroES (HSP10)